MDCRLSTKRSSSASSKPSACATRTSVFQRALTVAFEFAQRPQRQSGHLRQFTLRERLGKPLLPQTSTQRVQDLSGSREMKSHFYDP